METFFDLILLVFFLPTEHKKPFWQFDYRFNDTYLSSVTDENKEISAKVMMDLSSKLIDPSDKNKVWNNYIQERQVHYQSDASSRYRLYCADRHVTQEMYNLCIKKI